MEYRNLYIYHSNDLHSHFNQWPYITKIINAQRELHKENHEDVLYFDLGDHADRFDPITEATEGQGNTALLNEIEPNAVTIGNNEGMTFSKEKLNQLYKNANFPVLLANLFDTDGTLPCWARPYNYYKLIDGFTVAVIGVTIPYYPFYKKLGWLVKDPVELLPELIKEVRKEADMVILLSHMGLNLDEELAEQIDGIDLILGAHTHQLLKTGKLINKTMIAQAGKFGSNLGRVKITIDPHKKLIVNLVVDPIEIKNQEKLKSTVVLLEQLKEEATHISKEIVAELNEPLEIHWFEDSPAAKLLAEGLREWCGTDISMVNNGVLLEGLPKGPITKGDIHRICPHPINPCVVGIKGDQLKATIERSFTAKLQQLALKGYGFRGEVLGQMTFAGMKVETEMLGQDHIQVKSILIGEEDLQLEKMYKLATFDMFTFGYLYPALAESDEKEYFMPELIRDVFLWKLKQFR